MLQYAFQITIILRGIAIWHSTWCLQTTNIVEINMLTTGIVWTEWKFKWILKIQVDRIKFSSAEWRKHIVHKVKYMSVQHGAFHENVSTVKPVNSWQAQNQMFLHDKRHCWSYTFFPPVPFNGSSVVTTGSDDRNCQWPYWLAVTLIMFSLEMIWWSPYSVFVPSEAESHKRPPTVRVRAYRQHLRVRTCVFLFSFYYKR